MILHTNLRRHRDVVRENFPNFNLEIDLEKMSVDEHGRAVVALRRAMDKLNRSHEDDIKNAV